MLITAGGLVLMGIMFCFSEDFLFLAFSISTFLFSLIFPIFTDITSYFVRLHFMNEAQGGVKTAATMTSI